MKCVRETQERYKNWVLLTSRLLNIRNIPISRYEVKKNTSGFNLIILIFILTNIKKKAPKIGALIYIIKKNWSVYDDNQVSLDLRATAAVVTVSFCRYVSSDGTLTSLLDSS